MELTAILSDVSTRTPAGTGRFGLELTRALLATSEHTAGVAGYSHHLSAAERDRVLGSLPGLSRLTQSPLPRQLLARAWSLPVGARDLTGPVLAPSLFAPLRPRSRGSRLAPLLVTIHDLVPFTHPELLTARGARWHVRQIELAQRWADAILVPSETVAADLERFAPVGARAHVVPGAASLTPDSTRVPKGEPAVAPYIIFVGTLEPRKGLELLVGALTAAHLSGLQLVVAGGAGWGKVRLSKLLRERGLNPSRVRQLGYVSDAELAAWVQSAAALVMPSRAEGFGLPLVEAMSLGVPIIHSSDPALVETAGGAGVRVDLSGDAENGEARLAAAIADVLGDPGLAHDLRARGLNRSAHFSWEKSAHLVWRLLDS